MDVLGESGSNVAGMAGNYKVALITMLIDLFIAMFD
jgi:hypothetical protein